MNLSSLFFCLWTGSVSFHATFMTEGSEVPSVLFQHDEIPTKSSWMKFNGSIPDLTSFSVCFHIKVLKARPSYDSILSYAIPESTNEVYIGFQFPNAKYEIWRENGILFRSESLFHILTWYRTCYVHNEAQQKYQFWVNDKYEEQKPENFANTGSGGMLFLGQDQDKYGGDFSSDQSFHGYIADFHFFNRALTKREAESFVKCDPRFNSDAFANFVDIESDWVLNATLKIEMISSDEICSPKQPYYLMFPEKRSFEKTVQLCTNFGGHIPIPKNDYENNLLQPIVTDYRDVCSDGSGNTAWVGIKVNVENQSFYNHNDGKVPAYTNYNDEAFLEGYECSSMMSILQYVGKWFVAKCNIEPNCAICRFEDFSIVRTRGLCPMSLFDPLFLVFGYRNRKPHLRGYFFSDLRWDEDTWILEHLEDRGRTRARMVMKTPYDYPLGKHEWVIEGDLCSTESSVRSSIVFTSCNETQYTCDDGSCVSLSNRCDLLLNCPDQSDEFNCDIIQIPASYIKVLPPPEEDGSSVKVKVDMIVTSIRSFSLIDLTLSYDLTINLEWRDSRLLYQNLKDNIDNNQVTFSNVEEIWTPSFFLEDESGSKVKVTDHGAQTFVKREAEPLPDDVTRLKEDRLYKGSENFLSQRRVLTVSFLCQFDLSNYPFDIQTCKLVLRATQGKNSVQFVAGKAVFLGERRLLEYQVDEIFSEAYITNGYSEVIFVISFFNLFKYYIFGTYVPTSLIVFITYMTFFFGLKDFTNRVMVSLTALMVLAALFLQTSQGVARTAYMKLIDIWFLFCMVFNFVIILVLVVINFLQLENSPSSAPFRPTKVSPMGEKEVEAGASETAKEFLSRFLNPDRLNKIFRVVFPCLFLTMTVSYISFILSRWTIPSS